PEVRAGDARGRALYGQVVLNARLALLRAEAAGDPVELAVALDARVMRGEVPGLTREVLHRDVLELGVLLDEQLRDGVRVCSGVLGRRRVLLDQRGARAFLRDHDEPPERLARDGDAHVE